MSSIFISIGQCGNQLAGTLLDYLLLNNMNQTAYLYNYYDSKFRFVNLDCEAKVINNLYNDHKGNLRLENAINTKCGRGSNWASGYSGLQKDGAMKIIEQSIEAIRTEAERCDFLLNFNVMHSLSGGTGSGCGSKLLEQLRDEYGYKKYVFTQSVAPFQEGELPLQHYNNLLCLSYLHEFVDMVGLHLNDDIFRKLEKIQNEIYRSTSSSTLQSKTGLLPHNALKLTKKAGSSGNLPSNSISFEDLNSYIVKSFLSALYPVESISLKTQSIGMEFMELQRVLCSNKDLKIVEFYNVSKSMTKSMSTIESGVHRTNSLLKQMFTLMPKYKANTVHDQYTSLNSLIVARGFNEQNASYLVEELWKDFDFIKKSLNPVAWNPFTIDFWYAKSGLSDDLSLKSTTSSDKNNNTSIAVVTNRNKCVEYLSEVLEKAQIKYKARAYLHWYEKFNIGSDHFESAFEDLKFVINSYNEFTVQ